MPYYTGAANSMAGLLESVTTACVAEGWTWADSILSKGNVFVQLTANDAGSPSIRIRGGTGRADGALVNPSDTQLYLRRLSSSSSFEDISFPCTYHLFVFENPTEVYLVVQYGLDWHAWLAFGESSIAGVNEWFAASSPEPYNNHGIGINSSGSTINNSPCGGLFWRTSFWGGNWECDISLDGAWGGDLRTICASRYIQQLTDRALNTWNNNSVLLPIQPYLAVDGNKIQMLADIQNARYIRVDNYDSGLILTIGSEQWMIFPFIRKNSSERDGGYELNNTGTFGWAIRYDGNS